jgi:hypothetical protein
VKNFEEYQALAAQVPVSLRNDRDRINFPLLGLQGATGKIGSLLDRAFAKGKFNLTPEQREELQDRLSDILWCSALLCKETGMSLQDVAAHSIAQIQARATDLDPDRR